MNTLENVYKTKIQKLIKKYLPDKKIVKITFDVSENDIYFISIIKVLVVYTENILGAIERQCFFVKMAKHHITFRTLFSIRQMYIREIFVYKHILPQFVALQEKTKIVNQFKSYPKFYTSSDECLNEIVILENLIERGFKISGNLKSLDYNEAVLVIKEIGRFHALSFAVKDQLPLVYKNIFRKAEDLEYQGDFGKTTELFIQYFLSDCMKILKFEDANVYDKVTEMRDALFNTIQKASKFETAEPYCVLNHGDFWISNFLFKYDELSHPTEVCLVDFQSTKLCTPVSDVSQFLFACLSTETRRKYYKELINVYYDSLSTFLRELGSDPEKMFPFNVLQDHLKRFSAIGLYVSMKLLNFNSIYFETMQKFDESEDSLSVVKILVHSKKDINALTKGLDDLIYDFIDFGYSL